MVRQPRQLILACDGTNNTVTGETHDTNVLKLIGQLAPDSHDQQVFYDPGVGSPDQMPPLGLLNELNRRRERIAGLARGKGIYENIEEAYAFLIDQWQPGDQIYIFGFSRGAFTARCVAGMVNLFGIVRPECKSLLLTLIRVYFSTPCKATTETAGPWARFSVRRTQRRKDANEDIVAATRISNNPAPADVLNYLLKKKARKSTREEVAKQVREKFTSAHGSKAAVHFVGVWDTVESVGIPLLSRSITSDATTSKKDGLRHIRHALSMDEHRLSFSPRLYWENDYRIDDPKDPSNDRSLRQRWFQGVHSDVGGGYGVHEAGLSDQAFDWMLAEAIACGLRVGKTRRPDHAIRKPYIAHDASNDTPWWGIAGLGVRTNVYQVTSAGEQQIAVIPAGAAAESDPAIYSVWDVGARRRDWRLWVALLCAAVSLVVCGWCAHAAFHGNAWPVTFAEITEGAAQLDAWQRGYALDTWRALLASKSWPGPAHPVTEAYWAIIADLVFIAAYSWVLGLVAAWSFKEIARGRKPSDKVAPVFLLGMAPMFAVVADLAEDGLTLLTLLTLPTRWSLVFGTLLMFANVVKWAGIAGSSLLIACGILARTSRLPKMAAVPARV